ncbi:MAG: LPS export ABC transporter permease LptF [Piscinibacter sp.]|uniref:LPS export ABC transporter permease LptF n=1 Tax=Piscinibacter TaxID=1114981 RepID=UPI000FDDECB4|nr:MULTISPECIES: LPS export ABC transporter permease LptF [Piscinibacter]MCW5664201.1 LPS export ABC transporter permease LptF [Piscinibacter sp.]
MLFDSSLRADLARSFGATLVVILTIVLTMMLIRTLGLAAGGRIAPQDVVLLLGYTALAHLPTMLALSLFVAVVATLGRMYRDSEMTIWFASGVGLSRFVRPVLRTTWPVLLVIGLLALFVWPWMNQRVAELKERFERRSDLSRVVPGQFQSSSDGKRVFFIERDAGDGRTGRNVFILTSSGSVESVTSARSGRIELDGDDRFLVLDRGQRNERDAASGAKTLSRFENYRVLVGERALSSIEELPPRAKRSIELLFDPAPKNQGELVWRLGLLFGGTNLVLLAIPLSASNPRRASNWNLLIALLAFVVYYNLINLSQAWVAAGKLTLGSALLLFHGGAFVLALGLLWWREQGARRFGWSRPVRATPAAKA